MTKGPGDVVVHFESHLAINSGLGLHQNDIYCRALSNYFTIKISLYMVPFLDPPSNSFCSCIWHWNYSPGA